MTEGKGKKQKTKKKTRIHSLKANRSHLKIGHPNRKVVFPTSQPFFRCKLFSFWGNNHNPQPFSPFQKKKKKTRRPQELPWCHLPCECGHGCPPPDPAHPRSTYPEIGTWEMKKRLDKGGWVVMGWHFVVFVGWDQVHEENRKDSVPRILVGSKFHALAGYSLLISDMEREGRILLDPQWNYPSHCESTHTKKGNLKKCHLETRNIFPHPCFTRTCWCGLFAFVHFVCFSVFVFFPPFWSNHSLNPWPMAEIT